MRLMRAQNNQAARAGFSVIELMVVMAIIAIAISIGAAAYLRMIPEAQKKTATEHLRAVAGAIQIYYQEQRDYPPMRFEDIITKTNAPTVDAPWPNLNSGSLPNATQSIEAAVYALQYRSDAGKALSKLPTSVLRQVNNHSVTDGGQVRPLNVILDPWDNPVQYLRPRDIGVSAYPLSAERLNNRVLLISMGPDGMPGKGTVNDEDPALAKTNDTDIWPDTLGDTHKESFPDPKELGTGDDIVVEVGATR